jgi:hypothetical protein
MFTCSIQIPACRSEIKHIVRDGPSTCTCRSRMNHDHDSLFSPSAKAKAMGTIWSSRSTTTTIIKVPCTFRSGKCHQQVLLDDSTGMHVPSARMTRTHDAGHAATGPENSSLRCPQTISSQGCSNVLHTIFGEPCCMLPPSYPNESLGQFD